MDYETKESYSDDGLHRIVVVMAGYNKKKNFIQKAKEYISHNIIKKFYDEDLIDSRNKAAIVLDDESGKQTIEYVLDALDGIDNSHVIVVGDKPSLESIASKKTRTSVDSIVDQGYSFGENLSLGTEEWKKRYNSLVASDVTVSPQIYFVFGDTFLADKDSLVDAFRKIDKRDADISFTYCSKPEMEDSRLFFSYRPWANLKDTSFRNANVGARRYPIASDTIPRGVPEEKEYLAQIAYNVRKLLNPANVLRINRELGKDRNLVKRYFVDKDVTTKDIERVVSRIISTDDHSAEFALIPVDIRLEPDIDSKKDVIRAKKMNYLENRRKDMKDIASVEECESLIEECEKTGIKNIRVVGNKIKNRSIDEVKEELRRIDDVVFRWELDYIMNSFYTVDNTDVDYLGCLRYDLKNALLEKRK